MNEGEKANHFVSGPGDVTSVRRKARRLADEIGFPEPEAESIALVVTELATNIVKYAGSGVVALAHSRVEGREGITVEARDRGPGFSDDEQVMVDGYSTSGTLGHGLGAVNRMMDEVDILSDGERGTQIVATRFLRTPASRAASLATSPFDIGAVSRPHPKMTVNGDTFVIRHWNGHSLVAVIDGVGHGQYAQRASQAARSYIESHYDQPLDMIFKGAARACRGSRGVVMAIAVFRWSDGEIKFASIGNIETRLFGVNKTDKFHLRRGIVGLQMPTPHVVTDLWAPGATLVLFSDGISSRWSQADLGVDRDSPSARLAHRILMDHVKENDDATVAVVKDRRP